LEAKIVKKMKKTQLIILLLIFVGLSSCSKWLDLQPESNIDKSILFSTEQGFKEALLGIYTRAAKTDLYGKELTVGTPEVLVQNYYISAQDNYKYLPTKNYKYNDADFMNRKDNIWGGLYNGITNANLILENIESHKSLFIGDNYNLIKGEALALRGYLHFDVLRLFAPSPMINAQADAIPYVTQYSNQTTKLSKVTTVLDSVINDLEQAKVLLTNDPIRSASYIVGYPTNTDTLLNSELSNKDLFLQNRRHRLNYFAVCGALARVYLYKGDKANALLNANIVITAKKFPWTNKADAQSTDPSKKDRILYKEILFGWYIPTLNNAYNSNWFNQDNSGMYLEPSELASIYETSGTGATDIRYQQWFNVLNVNNTSTGIIVKYRRNSFSDEFDANLSYMIVPAIRLSEMYYIVAECTYESNPAEALAFINEVRANRDLTKTAIPNDKEAFYSLLLKEYRKETYAEGQLFYAYKRLNRAILGQQGEIIPPDQKIFVWPLPNDELIYGQR
jgi:SusD family.